ncbi:sugar transferase [Chachezhania sediminis]|uniref:sugar transferase n=1 Tax=Chachezhania sediminis TaxID=2599291 RepID=UPI00131B65B8|nr:sugar transferase [Chachezhania sediminis]
MSAAHTADFDKISNQAVQSAVSESERAFYPRFGKRVMDIVLALALLPVLLPVILVLWVLVRRDGGAGFFGHRRIGQNGRVFRCWKIRTMEVDAETKLIRYLAENPDAALEWERDRKLENDPRITSVGRFLRKTSLDELPQIWNVLKGDMSFVGPRPIVRSEMNKYGVYRDAYKTMRPGITGLWQVSGRNDISYDERVELDLQYMKTVSLRKDLELVVKTGTAVLGRTGK